MTPRSNAGSKRLSRQVTATQLATLADRLETIERQHQQLRRTIEAVGRETGVGIGSPCARCQRSYLLIKDGGMHCPVCGYQETL
ncbi:hypothetical protein [Halosolutus gelatinilyticus]|uniref:hypothetical protein n=1 Tax=Halosolutus gelatinilyticus TaxID=2931975 RepID=UPI001FF1BE1A|nr:hypothetical protein [Halosolutus gelatinilyticus]